MAVLVHSSRPTPVELTMRVGGVDPQEGKVRLGQNVGYFARLAPDRFCPCCTSGLTRVRNDLANVSLALARPLPTELVSHLGPLLDALRHNGRPVFDELAKSLRDGRRLPSCELFTASATVLIAEIDLLDADGTRLSTEDVDGLLALRVAFGQLVQSVQILMTDLNATSAEAPRKFEC